MPAEQGINQSVEKAVGVLAAFLDGSALRVSDVAKQIGLGQSSTSRFLGTLESLQFVERAEDGNRYRLGPAFLTFGGVAINQHPVHREARQVAQNLAASLGLGVNVAVRHGSSLLYLCNFEGKLAPRSFTLMGQRNPLHATGLGKCLLLGLTPGERRELLPDLHRYTPRTICDPEELDAAVDEVAHRGYAEELEELALGRSCVAAPILDQSGAVAAALSISGPVSEIGSTDRFPDLASTAIEVADSISAGLGYLGPHHGSATVNPFWQFPQYAQIQTAVTEQVQAVLVGNASAADAMTAAGEATTQGPID